MEQPPFDAWERYVRERAAEFAYPPTPTLRPRRAPRRRLQPVALLLLLVLALLLMAPGVRAGLRTFFEVGAIRIFPGEPLPTLTPLAGEPGTLAPLTLPPLAGESTLAEVRAGSDLPIRLPDDPAWGEPDKVYWQELEGEALIFLWLDPAEPTRVQLSLHLLSEPFWAAKFTPAEAVVPTRVRGQEAVWVAGPHYLETYDGEGRAHWKALQLVEGHTLIWVEEGVTHRLESTLSLEEAIRLAESLR